jgi:hypothetical protein
MTVVVKAVDIEVAGLSIEENGGRPLIVSGVASTFGDPPDTGSDIIAPGAGDPLERMAASLDRIASTIDRMVELMKACAREPH